MEAHLVELVLDLFQRFTTKVTNLDHLFLSLADQILDRVDVRTLQAIEAAHGEIQLFDRDAHEVVGLLLFLLHDHRLIRQILRQIGEQGEVVDQDLRGQQTLLELGGQGVNLSALLFLLSRVISA